MIIMEEMIGHGIQFMILLINKQVLGNLRIPMSLLLMTIKIQIMTNLRRTLGC